jgi:hypothetical protein
VVGLAEAKSTTLYKAVIVVLIIIIIGLYAFPSLPTSGNQSKAEENVLQIYKLIAGPNAEIIKTTEQNGLYKMTIRFTDTTTGKDTVQDVFVTKDGAMTVGNLADLALQRSLLTNQSAFAQCLVNKKVAVLGLSTDQATQLQLQVLGAFSGRNYIDCSGNNLVLCQQLNITSIPVIFYNNQLFQGPLAVQWFEQNIGCYMTASGEKA